MRTGSYLCGQGDLAAWASAGKRLVITGPSGSGKSHILDHLVLDGAKGFELDCVGSAIDGQWIVNPYAIPKGYSVLAGCCDNFLEVVQLFRPDYVVFVKPSSAKWSQLALWHKANEVPDGHVFQAWWREKSQLSTQAYWYHWRESVENAIREIEGGLHGLEKLGVPVKVPEIRIVTNTFKAAPTRGWHRWAPR